MLTNINKINKSKHVLFLDCHPSEILANTLTSFSVIDHHPIDYNLEKIPGFKKSFSKINSKLDIKSPSTASLLDSDSYLTQLANRSDNFFNYVNWQNDYNVIALEWLTQVDFNSTLERLINNNRFTENLNLNLYKSLFERCVQTQSLNCSIQGDIGVIQVAPWVSRVCELIRINHKLKLVINLNNTIVNLRGQGARELAKKYNGDGHKNAASFKPNNLDTIIDYLDKAKAILDKDTLHGTRLSNPSATTSSM